MGEVAGVSGQELLYLDSHWEVGLCTIGLGIIYNETDTWPTA